MRFLKAILATFLAFSFANADVVIKKVSDEKTAMGEGTGKTREEAVNNAIAEALGKINGVKLNSTKFVSNLIGATGDGKKFDFEYSEKISKQTDGKADGFEVENAYENSDGSWSATVSVRKNAKYKKEYKVSGLDPNLRRKIAVMPGYSKNPYVYIDGKQVYSQYVADDITRRLVGELTNTRKFTVLDREADDAYKKETAILSSKDAAKDEALKLGGVLGADYIVVFSLDKFNLSDAKSANITATSAGKKEIDASVYYRVIAMSTRQVKYSNQAIVKFNSKDAYEGGILAIAKKISDDIVRAIYPLKIASMNADEIIITQPLAVGATYDVYTTTGAKIKDPYTGELVAFAETKVAQASVVRADNKLSYLKIISGTAKIGDILRPSGKSTHDGRQTSDVKQTQSGGVVLPF